tara:strand:+ start:71 stop:205 length:135 start_codon:yes stop_codon:yes gene_type:complete
MLVDKYKVKIRLKNLKITVVWSILKRVADKDTLSTYFGAVADLQ